MPVRQAVGSRLRRLRRRAFGPPAGRLPAATRLDERPDLRQYEIGRYSWGHLTVSSRDAGTSLRIGQFCSFAYGTHIVLGGEHRADFVSTYRFPAYPPFSTAYGQLAASTASTKGRVEIGNDVWLGNQTLILSGVTIGDGAVVGAGSVVRHDVPPYAIVAGNPARVAGYRFPPEQIDALLSLRWWDWPLERITASLPLLMSDRVGEFIASAAIEDQRSVRQ
jgi:acetyltransferase-like isoleucine patch superfamily enzyme